MILAEHANIGMEESDKETGADMVPMFNINPEVQDYGMVGTVKLVTYTKIEIGLKP